VLGFLTSTGSHPTADEIGAAVNGAGPVLSRASVYNVLRTLCDAGLVREFVGAGALVRFDANLEQHHHFVCTRCRAVEDLPWSALSITVREGAAGERTVAGISVSLTGTCGACAAAEREKAPPTGGDGAL
jgi:Fur family transcriptional regulator, peroxide stress response regulator